MEPLLEDAGGNSAYGTVNSTYSKRKGGAAALCLRLVSGAVIVAILGFAFYFFLYNQTSPTKPTNAKTNSIAHSAERTTHPSPVPKTVARSGKESSKLHLPVTPREHAKSTPPLSEDELARLPADVVAALNISVDPCDNFYEFACGGWESVTTIPHWQSSWAKQWDGVTTDVEKMAVDVLNQDDGPAGKFYKSCMDTDTVQKLGAMPLKPWLSAVERIKDHASLVNALGMFAKADTTAFFGWWVDDYGGESGVNALFVAQGGTTMPDISYYTDQTPAMARHRKAFTTMVHDIMLLSGRSASESAADAANVLELETAMAREMKPDDEERDEHGSPVTLAELKGIMPTVDWPQFLSVLGIPKVGTAGGANLIVKNVKYLRAVDSIIKSASFEKIRSYLRWQAVYGFSPYLSFPFEDALVTYNKDLYGISVLPPRWRKCYFATQSAMSMAVSKLFVDKYFPEAARDSALEMLTQIRQQLNHSIQVRPWMDAVTKVKALAKLDNMFMQVGRPDTWPPSAFESYLQWGGMHTHRFFDNVVATNAYDVQKTLARLGKPVQRERWGSSSCTDVNSFYSRKVNGIFITAGILQTPFYSPTQAVARNYGSIGCICGHEMTHGFDDVGREYDALGNRNNWWGPAVVEKFKTHAKCIENLFASFTEYGHHVNGKLTLGEAIADSGGLKFSWESFLLQHKPEALDRKLFFLAQGQTWCQKQKRSGAIAALLTDQHPPTKYRVLGTLSQFKPFAETWSCAANTRMNPSERCDLW